MKRVYRYFDEPESATICKSDSEMAIEASIKSESASLNSFETDEDYDLDIFNKWLDEPFDDEELDPTYVDEEGAGESDGSGDEEERTARRIESRKYQKNLENVKFKVQIKNEDDNAGEQDVVEEDKDAWPIEDKSESARSGSFAILPSFRKYIQEEKDRESAANRDSTSPVQQPSNYTSDPPPDTIFSCTERQGTLQSEQRTDGPPLHRRGRIQYRRKPGKPPARLEELFRIPGLVSATFIPIRRARGDVEPDNDNRPQEPRERPPKRQRVLTKENDVRSADVQTKATTPVNPLLETVDDIDDWQQVDSYRPYEIGQFWAIDNIIVFQVLGLYTREEEGMEILAARIQLYLPYFRILNDNLHNDPKEVCEISHDDTPVYLRIGHYVPEKVHVTFLPWHDENPSNQDGPYKCRWKYTPADRCFTYTVPCTDSFRLTAGKTPTVADFFAGAGGLSKAAAEEGCNIEYAVEKDSDASNAWRENAIADRRANFAAASGQIFNMPIENYVESLLTKEIEIKHVDILLFGPPCQGFSRANPGGMNDTKNRNLVFYIAQTVFLIKPKYIMVENVPGILDAPGKFYFEAMLKDLLQLGYAVSYNILLAATFGDPQVRYRVILVASAPGYLHPYQPCAHITNTNEFNTVHRVLEGLSATTRNHTADHHPYLYPDWIYMNKRYLRLSIHPQQPATTLRAAPTDRWRCLRVIRPNPRANAQIRLLTPREAIMIQGFSRKFHLEGSYAAQFRQAGNAVPLGLGRAVIKSIIDAFRRNVSGAVTPFGRMIEVQGRLPRFDLEDDGREDLDIPLVHPRLRITQDNEIEYQIKDLPSLEDESKAVKDHEQRIDQFIVRVPYTIFVEPIATPQSEESGSEDTFIQEPDTDEIAERFSGNDPNTQEIWCVGTQTWKPKGAFNKRQQRLREDNKAKCEACLRNERRHQ
ncbi:Modification methylase SinI [Neolecta irregularis DAH-3]|uniref:DNA (cytosine-5-)-methyltransferase n=1 Tax=Neolecta irregularis (strain DAH-3) TaxID=1198029 RepID=A0A1U7LN47_NEOID|nr:Modification methylase SinI [Neolecta irregularis DAH-3]|eukprot:OLL24074.1 Modification methylase SinI [Neolecta irregularis DAH-3]